MRDGCNFGDARKGRDHVLDFIREYLEAGNYDDVLLAILDEHIAALVHAADIAGTQPAIREHDLGGLVGTLPVAAHHLGAAQADFPGCVDSEFGAGVIADADVGGRQRQANRAGEADAHQRIDAAGRRGLGETPALGKLAAGKLLPAFGHRALHGHAAADGGDESREIQVLETRSVHQRIEKSIHAHEEHGRSAAQFLHETLEITGVGDQVARAAERGEQQAVRGQ